MGHKSVSAVFLIVVVTSTMAALAGFWLGRMAPRSNSIVIIGDREREAHYRSTIEKLQSAGVDRREVEREAHMRPLVKAGPLLVRLNESTGEYAIYDREDPIVLKARDGDQTTVSYYALGGRVVVDLLYKEGARQLAHSGFSTFGDGGHLAGENKYLYLDTDADGRFDKFFDYDAGNLYELNDLRWVLTVSGLGKDSGREKSDSSNNGNGARWRRSSMGNRGVE
jgi:hypothetical protein